MLLPTWGMVLYISTWLLPDYFFLLIVIVFLVVSLLYVRLSWFTSRLDLSLDTDNAYIYITRNKQGYNHVEKHQLHFVQYGNLCLHAYYDTVEEANPSSILLQNAYVESSNVMHILSKYAHKVQRAFFIAGRKRLLIARDALPSTEYRTFQSFAAKQVRLKEDVALKQ